MAHPPLDKMLAKPGRYYIGGSVRLDVRSKNSALYEWLYRGISTRTGKPTILSKAIGSAIGPDKLGLKDAIRKAGALALERKNGVGPTPAKLPARAGRIPQPAPVTAGKLFSAAAADYLNRHKSQWGAKELTRFEGLLRDYAAPLNNRPVTEITVDEVRACLNAAKWPAPKAVNRLRPLLEGILNAADLPQPTVAAKSRLDMPKDRPQSKPHPSLPWRRGPEAMRALNGSEAANILRFIMLTGARRGEAVYANWSEFDLVNKMWTIPAERMKMKEAHRVPLSDAAIACLTPSTGRVFGISHYPVSELWDDLREKHDFRDPKQDKLAVIHGFRSTIAVWAQEQKPRYESDVIEAVLAHAERSKVKAAYQRSDLFDERVPLMAAWAAFVTGAKE
jgi:integrase